MREKLFRLLQAPWFIALVALLLRLAFLRYKISAIPAEVLANVPFQNEVGNVASALASGHGFACLFRQPTGPTAWLAPIYALLIATIFKLFGAFTFLAFCASVFLNSLFSALACFPLFHASERIAGKSTAVLATWLWTLSPIAIILPYAWIWDTSLSAFFAAALLWATLRLADRTSYQALALYSLLWGISLLTNPSLGALLPFLLLWLILPISNRQSRACHPEEREASASKDLNRSIISGSKLVLLCITFIVVMCLPWTIRNYRQFHRFIPLRSNFAYEFWSGNNEIFDPTSRRVNRITRYEQTHLYARLGESAFLDEKWQAAKIFVRTHPALYAQLCARRIIATWFGTDSPFDDFVHADSALARFLLLWNAVSFFAILAGLLRLYLRARPFFLPVVVFPLIFPITFYLAHTSLRHRHPADPILALLMAMAFRGLRVPNATETQETTNAPTNTNKLAS